MENWNIFPGVTSLEIFQKAQKNLQDQKIDSEHLEGRIIFLSMFNIIDWTKKENSEICISNSEQVKNYAKNIFRAYIDHSSAQENKSNGVERTLSNLKNSVLLLLMSC